MDAIANPYTPNAGSRPPELAGRSPQLDQFRVLVGRLRRGMTEQSIIVRGLRGVGKTVLLNAFEDIAENEDFLSYYHEMTPESELLADLVRDAEDALQRLSLSEKLSAKIRGALGRLKTIRLTGPDGFGLAVDLENATEADLSRELAELFLQLGAAAAEKGSGVVFLVDEVQFVDEAQYRALISALHRATQKNLPITLAAAGLPQIPRLTGEARSYAERLFDFPVIDRLNRDDALAALIEPARRMDVEFAADALELALEWTNGYPFYIQQLGKHAWNLAESSPIERSVVEAAIPSAQLVLDRSIYEVRFQRTTERERTYLQAMAEAGGGKPARTGEIAKRLGKSTSSLSPTRQQLIDKGIIYATEDHGYVDFTVPLFGEYVLRKLGRSGET